MVQKAWIETEQGGRIDCLFNPAELRVTKSNMWEEGPRAGKSAPNLMFAGGGSGTLSMELIFDTTAEGTAVTTYTDQLLVLMNVDDSLAGFDQSANTGRPPWVKFHWGDFHSIKAIVENLDITYTYFSSTGVPLRAKARVQLRQFEDAPAWTNQNPTSGTPRPHRVHQFQRGETLDRIASRYYADPGQWRAIAAANGIEDPLGITPGTSLVIPELEADLG